MKKNNKVSIILVSILIIAVIAGSTYAYYMFTRPQQEKNVIKTDCFEITYTDSNNINLVNAYPVSDVVGSKLIPYTFTIANVCNADADYNVNLETLSSTTIELNYLKYKFNDNAPSLLSSLATNSDNTIEGAVSRTLDQGTLLSGESKTYNLRLWIDIDSTYEQSSNKIYEGKIVVKSSLNKNRVLP